MGRATDSQMRKQGEGPDRVRRKVGGDADWRGFLNVSLTNEQKDAFEVEMQRGSLWVVFDEALLTGVHLSVKLDKDGKTFLAACTQRNSASVNAGVCVTARGRDAVTALCRVLFILSVLGLGTDWEIGHPLADPDRW